LAKGWAFRTTARNCGGLSVHSADRRATSHLRFMPRRRTELSPSQTKHCILYDLCAGWCLLATCWRNSAKTALRESDEIANRSRQSEHSTLGGSTLTMCKQGVLLLAILQVSHRLGRIDTTVGINLHHFSGVFPQCFWGSAGGH
jgi:hypothetical protein